MSDDLKAEFDGNTWFRLDPSCEEFKVLFVAER